MENKTMLGGTAEPRLDESAWAGTGAGWEFDVRTPLGVAMPVLKKTPADDPKQDPEDDPGDVPADDEDLEEVDEDELDGDPDEDDDEYPEVDDDLIDLDDEWDDQEEEERHDNPHKFYE